MILMNLLDVLDVKIIYQSLILVNMKQIILHIKLIKTASLSMIWLIAVMAVMWSW